MGHFVSPKTRTENRASGGAQILMEATLVHSASLRKVKNLLTAGQLGLWKLNGVAAVEIFIFHEYWILLNLFERCSMSWTFWCTFQKARPDFCTINGGRDIANFHYGDKPFKCKKCGKCTPLSSGINTAKSSISLARLTLQKWSTSFYSDQLWNENDTWNIIAMWSGFYFCLVLYH